MWSDQKCIWSFGPAPPYWGEQSPPSGDFYSTVFEPAHFSEEQDNLLRLLDALNVMSYKPFYEDVYQLRIRA